MFYRSSPTPAGDADVITNAPLTVAQFDGNNKNISNRLQDLEAVTADGWVGLDPTTPFVIEGNNLYAKLSNGMTYGPYPIPTVSWNLTNKPTGAWLPSHQYYVFDVFNYGPKLYQVQVQHVSGVTFDPTANDGLGHNYYAVVMELPAIPPTGGTTGQALVKRTNTDYDVIWSSISFSFILGSTSISSGGTVTSVNGMTHLGFTGATADITGLNSLTFAGTLPSITGLVSLSFGTNGLLSNLKDLNLIGGGAIRISDAVLTRSGPANWQFGEADNATPVAQSLGVQNVATGNTDASGADFTFRGSRGTGWGSGGDIIFQVAPLTPATGSTPNSYQNALILDGNYGGGRFLRSVRSSKTNDVTLSSDDSGTQYDNDGAAITVNFYLPTPVPGLNFGFCVASAHSLVVHAGTGTKVAVGSSISVTAGQVASSTPYSYLVLEAINATTWVAKSSTGTWTVT